MSWEKEYKEKLCTPEEAVSIVKSGDTVFFGTASSYPYKLAEALYKRKRELFGVTICSGMTSRPLGYFTEDADMHFSTVTYFAGASERKGIQCGQTDYTSFHLSQIDVWCKETAHPNVAFLEVSPPDADGNMYYGAYGVSMHECIRECASTVILQVNRNVPRVFGICNTIHVSQADRIVEADDELVEFISAPFHAAVKKISEYVVERIPDEAVIQLGIGGISAAVGLGLKEKKNLGIHSEMLTDSMMELMKLGVVNNSRKSYMPGKSVAAFAFGSKELYTFIDQNPEIFFAPYTMVNDVREIAKNDNLMSINTAMSVDLYGQVYADCLGGKQQSAIGGQLDYVRGAQMSKGGMSFIALESTWKKPDGSIGSRICATAPLGSAVTTPRSDVQYVVTEYGCLNLKPLTAYQRALGLIGLAHPAFRDELTWQAKQLGLL